jgi:hypothetical protein
MPNSWSVVPMNTVDPITGSFVPAGLKREEKKFFQHRLTPALLAKAKTHPRDAFPQHMPCVVCGFEWMAHLGLLCPSQEGEIHPLSGPNGGFIIALPEFDGVNLFVPDENWDKEPGRDSSPNIVL